MPKPFVRSEQHKLQARPDEREDMARTIQFYRRAVRMLCGVLMVHWPEISKSPSQCQFVESLFHFTNNRPVVKYPVLDRALGKMPSYLRRAAIESALGAVSSFMSNWSNFLDGEMAGKARKEGCRPPRLGISNVFPPLYGGNMILYGEKLRTVQVKLLDARGKWAFTRPIPLKGGFKRLQPLAGKMDLSPTLVLSGAHASLSCPVQMNRDFYVTNAAFRHSVHSEAKERVCAIDVGINTAATAVIVDASGTVIARRFFSCGRHNDQRDRLTDVISAKRSMSGSSMKGQPFCTKLYERITGLGTDAARKLSAAIKAFALTFGAKVLVIEDLKGWKPRGKGPKQRQRFHRFEHRKLVEHLKWKAEEHGMRVLEVFARGTSRWAYDGSGKVVRSRENYSNATFASGKKYNADLNGANNIAARGLAMLLGIRPQEYPADGKSSSPGERMPLVLSHVWKWVAAKAAKRTTRPL
jgi:IS605 OrfB family transposase